MNSTSHNTPSAGNAKAEAKVEAKPPALSRVWDAKTESESDETPLDSGAAQPPEPEFSDVPQLVEVCETLSALLASDNDPAYKVSCCFPFSSFEVALSWMSNWPERGLQVDIPFCVERLSCVYMGCLLQDWVLRDIDKQMSLSMISARVYSEALWKCVPPFLSAVRLSLGCCHLASDSLCRRCCFGYSTSPKHWRRKRSRAMPLMLMYVCCLLRLSPAAVSPQRGTLPLDSLPCDWIQTDASWLSMPEMSAFATICRFRDQAHSILSAGERTPKLFSTQEVKKWFEPYVVRFTLLHAYFIASRAAVIMLSLRLGFMVRPSGGVVHDYPVMHVW